VLRDALVDAERLADLAGDLLLLARLDGGEPLPEAPVDVADLARSCVAGRRRRGAVRVDVTCRASASATVTGSAQLGRMLGNLLDNAVRHARSRVTVTVRAGAGAVVVEVADDGPGVPAAGRELVFERFARLDDARGHDEGGAGLGLPIAREIAVRHGGSLVVAESVLGARLVAWRPAAA
jgi:signal transduction histidine kinase